LQPAQLPVKKSGSLISNEEGMLKAFGHDRLTRITMKKTLPSIVIAITGSMFASSALGNDCESHSASMAEVRCCIVAESDRAVEASYTKLYSRMKARNEKAAVLLQEAQAAWLEFVDKSCAFQAEFNPDGMIPADAAANCRVDFGRARTRVLTSWGTHL